MAGIVCLARSYEPAEAAVLLSALEAAGFCAFLPEGRHASVAWHHVFALQGLRVWVVDADLDGARALLAEVAREGPAPPERPKDIRPLDLALAAGAFLLTGLPLPLWRRRRA